MNSSSQIEQTLTQSWGKITPTWPLKNLIAVNPLGGFEGLPFEQALKLGKAYFGQKTLPEPMERVNIETIKWLQVFFDEGQATIQMPLRHLGLLRSVYSFLEADFPKLKSLWPDGLPLDRNVVIANVLDYLDIPHNSYGDYLTLMLTTLPGWASYIKYKTSWESCETQTTPPLELEYMALRLLMVYLFFTEGKELLQWHESFFQEITTGKTMNTIEISEKKYRDYLLKNIGTPRNQHRAYDAQLVFCIDVRSEGFRRAIEDQGNYETFGFAGFFGIPIGFKNDLTGESYGSCPVLLKPAHEVSLNKENIHARKVFKRQSFFKRLYQSLKYNMSTPFALVESLGLLAGVAMVGRTFFPSLSSKARLAVNGGIQNFPDQASIDNIPFKDQCAYALNALKMMGLVRDFSPLIVFCGHGSQTENNAYATALDCGACGGRHGGGNAFILSTILNKKEVRAYLKKEGITIPKTTDFISAEHNTTTDAVTFFDNHLTEDILEKLFCLKGDLEKAKDVYAKKRFAKLSTNKDALFFPDNRAQDWAQVRPEWGLAKNASFIVAPRDMTKDHSLEGRSFLHSYDWAIDEDGALLTTILTAPMIVAQWINCQYLFSTLDNVAFGGGSKITKNITGKIGIMQGNSSDLMHGLPLQSVFKSDQDPYHEPLRLLSVIYAPRARVRDIISKQSLLEKLLSHEWVKLICIDPVEHKHYQLTKELEWDLLKNATMSS